ncbi:MAG TPA: hypothetical protein VIE68_08240 [Gemmatimonadota bacterium]|jgi:hypothetical protein
MSIRICDQCGNVYDEDAAIVGRRVYDLESDLPFVSLCPRCGSPEFVSVPDRIAERRPSLQKERLAPASR